MCIILFVSLFACWLVVFNGRCTGTKLLMARKTGARVSLGESFEFVFVDIENCAVVL